MFQLLERSGLDDDPRAAMLVGAAAVHPSPDVAEKIQQLVSLKAAKHYQYPFSESERSELLDKVDEQITLGTTFTGSTYTLHTDDLTKHVLVTGRSGAGKTTLFYTLMRELGSQDVPWWAFDLKQDYRHLVRTDLDVTVLPWQQLRINPLRPPPGVAPVRWIQVVAEVFCHANNLLDASKNAFIKNAVAEYRDSGVLPAEGADAATTGFAVNPDGWDTVEWPTMVDVAARVERGREHLDSWKQKQYHDTVSNRLWTIRHLTGDVFDNPRGMPLVELLEQNVVFEFGGLMSALQDFLMELLFAWVYEYRTAQSERGEGVRHAFFLDEAKRVFSVYKERQDAAGLPPSAEAIAKMREFHESVIAADQEPTKLTDSIKANTYTNILLSMGDRKQFEAAVGGMNLSERQHRFAKDLEVGQAVVQQGGGTAVPVQFPEVDIEKSVTDAELKDLQQDVWNELQDTTSSTADTVRDTENVGETVEQADKAEQSLPDRARALLDDVAANPYRNLTWHYDTLDLSRYAGNKAKEELVRRDLVKPIEIRKKYGRPTILGLTERGRSYLRQCGVTVEREGRGGTRHCYWQQFLAGLFGDVGVEAAIECDDADIAVEMGGQRVAVEVAMEPANREVDHVEDRLADGFDRVVVGCRNERVRADLVRKLQAAGYAADDCVQVLVLRRLQSKVEDMT